MGQREERPAERRSKWTAPNMSNATKDPIVTLAEAVVSGVVASGLNAGDPRVDIFRDGKFVMASVDGTVANEGFTTEETARLTVAATDLDRFHEVVDELYAWLQRVVWPSGGGTHV